MGNLADVIKKTVIVGGFVVLGYVPINAQKDGTHYLKNSYKDKDNYCSLNTYKPNKGRTLPFLNPRINYCYKTTSRKERAFVRKMKREQKPVKCSFNKSSHYKKRLGK